MQGKAWAKPLPATAVAIVALVAGVTGVAVADQKSKKVTPKKVKKIADREINNLAPDLSVANARTADSATTANRAGSATTANRAGSATTANSATTAAQAQNASTANGIKPIKINYAVANPNLALTTLFNQGGLKIEGQCGTVAVFDATSTANNGAIKVDIQPPGGNDVTAKTDLDFDAGDGFTLDTLPADEGPNPTLGITYRAANGTVVSGELLMATGTAAADCVITGTLFVG